VCFVLFFFGFGRGRRTGRGRNGVEVPGRAGTARGIHSGWATGPGIREKDDRLAALEARGAIVLVVRLHEVGVMRRVVVGRRVEQWRWGRIRLLNSGRLRGDSSRKARTISS